MNQKYLSTNGLRFVTEMMHFAESQIVEKRGALDEDEADRLIGMAQTYRDEQAVLGRTLLYLRYSLPWTKLGASRLDRGVGELIDLDLAA